MKVCICATYHAQYNGYAKVAFELSRRLGVKGDIHLTYYGFQNFHPAGAKHKRDLPECVTVYDAAANENPKNKGFGIDDAQRYFTENEFDVVIIYNDMIIISALIEQIKKIQDRKFKVVAYIDQVYLYQKKPFIDAVNMNCDAAMAFTPAWKDCLVEQGLTVPIIDLRHGIDTSTYFTVPKKLARKYFGLSQDDFIVMNLNRNQPRKRWDVCLKAFAEAVSRTQGKEYTRPLKLLIATSLTGAWNLLEVYERELKKRNMTMEQGQKHLIIIDAPQRLPDSDVNILMNCADVGINTCDGEGFGLCQFEQAAVGVPQVVPNIGGFADFFNMENAIMCDPILNYYVDACRDGVGGEAQICDYSDFTAGILTLYKNPDMLRAYGHKAKDAITNSDSYNWDRLTDRLYDFVKEVVSEDRAGCPPTPVAPSPASASVPAPASASTSTDADADADADAVDTRETLTSTEPVLAGTSNYTCTETKTETKTESSKISSMESSTESNTDAGTTWDPECDSESLLHDTVKPPDSGTTPPDSSDREEEPLDVNLVQLPEPIYDLSEFKKQLEILRTMIQKLETDHDRQNRVVESPRAG